MFIPLTDQTSYPRRIAYATGGEPVVTANKFKQQGVSVPEFPCQNRIIRGPSCLSQEIIRGSDVAGLL